AKSSNMAIYFAEMDYLESFMNYISERNTGFICCGFTRSENLKEYAKENHIAVLLTDSACFEKDARHINSEMTVVLTERPDTETPPGVYTVNILQPVDEIVREILKAAARMDITVTQEALSPALSIYSFFSPVGRCLKTTLAIAAAQHLSDRDRTIYINLEPDSGFSVIFGREYDTDLSDLMFYLRDGSCDSASLMLQSAVCDSQGISYIPSVINPGDLFQISCDEIIDLFDVLQGNGYKNIVLDLGTLLPGFEKLLALSEKIFMPVRNDSISAAKTSQLFSYLRTLEDIRIEDKIRNLEPPYFKDLPVISGNMRSTEVGRYILGYLEN
ncbi:MAG: hypothetical protein J5966_02160, partial [Lachnospiraceae bacterium]|nr:hypothetical protein [Lachnospiraceae bacterium]